jgi:hypothetical protein
MSNSNYFGEVIYSTVAGWATQAWQWETYPDFGSVVVVQSEQLQIFGVVYHIKTGSDDQSRQAFAYQKTAIELAQEQPQIFAFLKTDFSSIPLGYEQNNRLVYAMPPRPPKIHSFVRLANYDELRFLLENPCSVQALFSHYSKIEYFEELLLAFLRYLEQHQLISRPLLMQVSHQLSLVTANDYRRLKMFMDRVSDLNISICLK